VTISERYNELKKRWTKAEEFFSKGQYTEKHVKALQDLSKEMATVGKQMEMSKTL
jgi:hypothetical protein